MKPYAEYTNNQKEIAMHMDLKTAIELKEHLFNQLQILETPYGKTIDEFDNHIRLTKLNLVHKLYKSLHNVLLASPTNNT